MQVWPHRTQSYRTGYFPSLDGLRALSIAPVVWHHCTPYPYDGLLGRGAVGVDLFFAISGFLITTLLLRERVERQSIDLVGFYVRRSLRIFPLYFLVLGLNVAFALWVRPDWDPSRRFLALVPYYAVFTANWVKSSQLAGPALFVFAWSLCTEEQFYAFWAPLLRGTRRLAWAACGMGLWLLVDLMLESRFWAAQLAVPEGLRTVLTSFATPIGFGSLLAIAVQHPRWRPTLLRWLAPQWMAPATLAVVVALLVWPCVPVVVLHALLAWLVLACATQARHGGLSWLEQGALLYVGRISYGIYLWHVAVIGGIKVLLPNLASQPGLLYVLGFPLSIVVASVSHRYFETPISALGRRWYWTLDERRSSTVARDRAL